LEPHHKVSSGLTILATLTMFTLGVCFNKPVSEGASHAVTAFDTVLSWNDTLPMDVTVGFFQAAQQGVDKLLSTSAQVDAATAALNHTAHRMQVQYIIHHTPYTILIFLPLVHH
jgi:hypothetical protein